MVHAVCGIKRMDDPGACTGGWCSLPKDLLLTYCDSQFQNVTLVCRPWERSLREGVRFLQPAVLRGKPLCASFPSLQALDLSRYGPGDQDLPLISRCLRLQSLTLSCAWVTKPGACVRITSLRALYYVMHFCLSSPYDDSWQY